MIEPPACLIFNRGRGGNQSSALAAGGVIAGKGGAAEILAINLLTLRSRMKKLGLL